ncbi:PAP1-domain-containing protein [Nemania sp. NC0429]|nr:PAP1-domain-containing protein [Nemania sp. NC0429]
MASARPNILPNFILTPQQQNLLFRALTSNQPNSAKADQGSLTPDSLTTSPAQHQRTLGFHESAGPSDSPFLDYDYDGGPDSSFGFDFNGDQVDDQARMIGDLPGSSPESSDGLKDTSKASSPDNESSDKRSHPDDDDDDEVEGGAKRREGEGKVPKKPGRKPLTNEPSSKRKAQNRAAQRAFRERKEKHLKDLETKVEELEKASTVTNDENSHLRAQIEKLNVELEQYKKKLSVVTNRSRSSTGASRHSTFGSAAIQNINDVNFQFEFPKFGMFPGPNPTAINGTKQPSPNPSPSSVRSPHSQTSPPDQTKTGGSDDSSKTRQNPERQQTNDSDPFNRSGLFDGSNSNSGSRSSLDSAQFSLNGANTGSPSSSANSVMGPSSSCGTSPEPFTQSPLGFKPLETLTTIGEEQPGLTSDNMSTFMLIHCIAFGHFGNLDFTNLDWLTQQNGGQFDPQLFGDYREPQTNILANTTFDDTFFNDAFDADFLAPFNAPTITSPKSAKKDICAEIDARKESEDTILTTSNGKLLTCTNIWEQLQGCPKVQSGDLDLDGLCSDLQKKAKCGGSGAVVDERDFKAVMTKYLGDSCSNP